MSDSTPRSLIQRRRRNTGSTSPTRARNHLSMKYYKAWECNCNEYCKGSQFFGHGKYTEINTSKLNHNEKSPWEFLNIDKSNHNSLLCHWCYNEVPTGKEQGLSLQHARKFSLRNGFGPVSRNISPQGIDPIIQRNIDIENELQSLISSFTAVEEAVIRQITPLISIVHLTHENIGMHGNTICVWQKSKLNLILPNLPSACSFIMNGAIGIVRDIVFEKLMDREKSILQCLHMLLLSFQFYYSK